MSTPRDRALPAERLLSAAATLFARDGIRAVGVDRLLAEAKVARASLYQTYGSKDALVVAYLRHQDEQDRSGYARASAGVTDPAARLLLVFDLAAKSARRRRFRGCLYLNAATEFPDARHPVIGVVHDHREWLRELWRSCLTELGVAAPGPLVDRLVVLYDGGLAGSKATRSTEPITLAREMAAQLIAEHLRDGDRSPVPSRT
ncbi:TetR/AcrR family transcriptional regulator [Amycolatopsis viridis]|uniref:AcrR family transcriptional regulator n=1 Tax=Amycolatopsis viridis TaxID=185678 RepID=A0ABX0SZE0_9PSEU|nr:TetR/AcrR family transcriptional regulator [Amycolatopsis viridis]NIH80965.1 AcrR family transcriptional regulator [Amycolatopsis viridis]